MAAIEEAPSIFELPALRVAVGLSDGAKAGIRVSDRTHFLPADRQLPNFAAGFGVQVRLKEMELHRPRQWGACWLGCHLYEQLELDEFWAERLPDSRERTCWQHILETLVCYRLIDPGSEWRLHRQWFEQSAMADLL